MPPYPELNRMTLLCDRQGNLNDAAPGWSKKPFIISNMSRRYLRKKRWRYIMINNEDYAFSVTFSDIDYAGLVCLYFIDFRQKTREEENYVSPLGANCDFSNLVSGNDFVTRRKVNVAYYYPDATRRLAVWAKDFNRKELTANFKFHKAGEYESYNAVIPFKNNNFIYTNKKLCLPVEGELRIGDKTYLFSPDSAFACVDLNRGVWPYRTYWNWASFSGMADGVPLGLSLIRGYTDGTGITENFLSRAGKISRIEEEVAFSFDKKNFMKPWQINSVGSDSLSLEFVPFLERKIQRNLLVSMIDIHQLFGRYRGHVTYAGKKIAVTNVLGYAEQWDSRW